MHTNKKGKIYVYSGTGNCYAAARQIAQALDFDVIHLTNELSEEKTNIITHAAVIIYPTYAYGMPFTVKRFILNNTFNVDYLAVLTTFGSRHGGALAEAIRLFRKRKQKTHYTMGIKAVENYVHFFGHVKQKTSDKRTTMQKQKTDKIITDIQNKKANRRLRFRPFSTFAAFVGRRGFRILSKRYKVLDTCNSCGLCKKICPAAAITLIPDKNEKSVPVFNHKTCDHCQGCLQLCPQRALKFGRIKPESPRYKHPDTNLKDLIKR